MTDEQLEKIKHWDKRCGDNEGMMFGTTIDRRRLIEYVDELRAENKTLNELRAENEALKTALEYWRNIDL